MRIRPRAERDLPACVRVAEQVRDLDGYPAYLPGGDFLAFLVSDDALASWVAESGGAVVGHVALHRRSSLPVLELAGRALGLQPDRIALVARLMVHPEHRGRGIGRALLEAAARESWRRGRWPALDVLTSSTPAIALYERCGWTRAGGVDVTFHRSGVTLEEAVFLEPPPGPAGGGDNDLAP